MFHNHVQLEESTVPQLIAEVSWVKRQEKLKNAVVGSLNFIFPDEHIVVMSPSTRSYGMSLL